MHQIKYRGCLALADFFAQLTTDWTEKNIPIPHDAVCVPVPLHWARAADRGYNQAEILATVLSQRAGIACALRTLVRTRSTKAQYRLSRSQRASNVRNAFYCALPERIYRRPVVLVDDIYTTGATLNECSRVLKAAGAGRITAVTVARS